VDIGTPGACLHRGFLESDSNRNLPLRVVKSSPPCNGSNLRYDPTLVELDADGASHNLAVESALAHPDIPKLVTSFTPAETEAAASVMAQAQNFELGAQDRSEMLVQVNQLMTSRPGGSSCSETHRVRAQRSVPEHHPRPSW
jgi:hypothetical protein